MRTWRISSLAIAALLAGCGGGQPWGDPERDSRLPVSVSANASGRVDGIVSMSGEFNESMRVVEVNEEELLVDDSVPFQVDFQRDLTFLMKGSTPPDAFRFYHVYSGEGAEPEFRPLVTATDRAMHQGQESILVTTPRGSYYFHKRGGGFASVIDADNKDWVGYNPAEGSSGALRGIPNLIYPEGGLHPGAGACRSDLLTDGPLVARIHSSCHDGAWEAEWEFYPHYATLTVEKAAHPYWFLYEGTPGGEFNLDTGYWVSSDGARRPAGEKWEGRLDAPRWVYFGDASSPRVLMLAHHEDDGAYDQYYPMDGRMAVFGFGRQLGCCEMSLEQAPARFTIAFVESTGHAEVTAAVNSLLKNLIITRGRVERRAGG